MKGFYDKRRKKETTAKLLFSGLILLLAAADQAVKQLVMARMRYQDIPVIGNVLHFTYAENTGAAFSFFEGRTWILAVITALMVCVCLFFLYRGLLKGKMGNLALALICAGGLGNLYDRVFRGYVIDFIYFKIIHFAIFNLADSLVVVGAILLCLHLLLADRKEKRGGVFH